MNADSQLTQLNNPGMQPCSATTVEHACARCQDQTGALHMFCDTNESESCLVKAPAKHASESVLVVGELLCTGVQANTERHTRKETREMCSCWGYKQQRVIQGIWFFPLVVGSPSPPHVETLQGFYKVPFPVAVSQTYTARRAAASLLEVLGVMQGLVRTECYV